MLISTSLPSLVKGSFSTINSFCLHNNFWQSLKREFKHKKFLWELVEEIERPRVVNVRVAPFQTKENVFAQIVVRLHTKQVQAVTLCVTIEIAMLPA